MKIPGIDHPITIEKNPKRVKITFNGQVIADTTRSLKLREATLPAVQYIPREDVNMNLLEPSSHSTHCPYKGDAGYYSITVDGKTVENAVWYYATPYPAVAQILDHVAFYPNNVDSIDEV
jgi:uncharacterized protein (DUF427 family)